MNQDEVCFAFENDGPGTQTRCVITGFGNHGGSVILTSTDLGALIDFMRCGGDVMAETIYDLERDASQWERDGKPNEAQP